MLLRRYGSRLQSVELNFDSKALNEIGFRRDHAVALDPDEFLATHTRVAGTKTSPGFFSVVTIPTWSNCMGGISMSPLGWKFQ